MKTQSIPHLKEQRGIILVVAILVMAVLLILGMALLSMSGTEDAIVSNYQSQIQAFYAAEAGIESGVGELKALVAATDVPTDAELAALTPPTLSNASYSFASLQAQRVRSTPPYSYRVVVDSGPYAGLNAEATDYQVTAEVVGPTGSRARISHVVQHVEIPLFQYGAFYGRGVDLEVYPGRPMTFNGKVHANSDIYLTADGGGSLDFDSYLTSAGSIYRHK
ncbi:MAG: PilX N-terminal domain-containing pilus assembly protein, partial [Candidatus Methylomirabilales bacterium]